MVFINRKTLTRSAIALPAALALGIATGLKHAFEPDHVIAVSATQYDKTLTSRHSPSGAPVDLKIA